MDWKGFGLIATLGALSVSHAQGAVGGAGYRCTVVSRGQLQDDGSLRSDDWTRMLDKAYRTFSYDSASGILRWDGGSLAWQYRTTQEGGDSNDLVAIRTMQGAASFVVNVLRIRPWEPKAPFLLVEQAEVVSGTCARQ